MADSVKIKITGDDSQFNKTLGGIEKHAKGAMSSVGSVFKGIMASQIVTRGISMLTNGLRSAINTGMEFGAAMSQVAAISGATGDELERLAETAKHYGETTVFSASQAAEALNYMALAGWDAQQSIDALGGVLDLAAASGMDLGAASDAVTDYLSAFGMQASQAGYMADMMAYAQSKSNTSASQLADAYGNCASSMHAAGQDIETTTAFLMALANQGIKGSEAGTQMAAVMRDLTQKMDNGAIKIGKASVAVQDAQGNFRDLNEIMTDIGKATEGLGTAEASAALMETFTARSIKAVNTILSEGTASVDAYEAALRDSTGTAAEQAEQMMDNLAGDVKVFQSALEGLQITASESMDGTARTLVQEATGIIDSLNQAGKAGGISGIFDAALAQIPKLLPKVVKGVQGLLQGLGKRLPGFVKGLMAGLPEMLGGISELVPGLADALFDGAAQAVESLIGMLPQLAPKLLEGVWNLGESVVNGAIKVLDGAFDSLALATGLRGKTLGEILDDRIAEVDQDRVKELSGSIEANYTFDPVTIDVEAYTQALTEAMGEIKETIEGITDISAADKLRIYAAVMSGSGAAAFEAALQALNVPQDKIDSAKQSLTDAYATINGTLSELQLNPEQKQRILEDLAAGNDIEASLISFGVDPTVASKAALDLQQSMATLNEGISGLDIDSSPIIGFAGESSIDNMLIAAGLSALKVDPAEISEVTSSYNVLSGTLSAEIASAFSSLKASLTNGIPDKNDPEFATAKQKVREFFEEAYSVVDEWERGKIQALEDSGLTGTDLTEKIATVKAEAQGMRDELSALETGTDEWVDANAGAAGSVVQQHFDELDALVAKVFGLDAKISELQGSVSSAGSTNRRAVEQGLVPDQKGQLEAMNYTAQELDHALQMANDKAAKALEAAETEFANDTAGYAARRSEIMATLAEEESQAYSTYDDHMRKIVAGMAKSNPELAEAYEQYYKAVVPADAGKRLIDSINEAAAVAAEGNINPADWFRENSGITDADYEAMAASLGIDPSVLREKVTEILNSDNVAGGSLWDIEGFKEMLNPEQLLTDAFSDIDLSAPGGVIETLAAALNAGLLRDGGALDWTNLENIATEGAKAAGESVPDGIKTGIMSTSDQATAAATTVGEAVVSALDDSVGHHSPSSYGKDAGASIPEGVALGIESGTGEVTAAAQTLGSTAVNAVKGSATGTDAAGRALAAGVARGITAGRSQVINAAVQLAQATVQAIRDALQIHSPSRVGIGLGANFGEAFGSGLESSLSSALRSAQTVVGLTNLAPKMDFGGLTGSFGRMLQGFADAESDRPIDLYLNGRRVASTMDGDHARAGAAFNRRVALGYGK